MTEKSESGLLTSAETAEKRLAGAPRVDLESAPDATLLIRPDGAIAELNHYAEALFGYQREELLGRNLSVLIPERFRDAHTHHFAKYRNEPRPRAMGSGMDLWGLRKDGSEFPVDIALSPRPTPGVVHFVCSIRDLSARLLHTVEKQLSFEKLVTDISARFAGLSRGSVEDGIVCSLQQIVEFMGVDRSTLGEFSAERGTLTLTHSYSVPGIPPMPRTIMDDQFPWYTTQLRKGEILRYERLPDDLPPDAAAERQYVLATGFRSNLTIPLKIGGSVTHVLAMGSFRSYCKWSDELVQRLQLLGQILASAVARGRAQRTLEQQLDFERLVTDISARFANLRLEDVDAEISHSLQEIAEFLEIDRLGFGEFSSDQSTLTTTHFYAVPGVPPIPPMILSTQFPWYTARLRRGEIHRHASLPDGLPPEAEQEREYAHEVGMKAHLSIPIKVGGSVAYVLPVDSFRSPRDWPDAFVGRLQLLGEIFAGALLRKRVLEALQESEVKFRLLAETATCGIAIYQDDRFQYVSPQATEITGYSAEEMLSMSVERLIHPDSRAMVLERAERRMRGEVVPPRYEIRVLTKSGAERWVDFTAAVTQYRGRPAIIGTAFDVTERKKAEAELHALSGRLIRAQEEERTRIARELHDDLSQRLALVTIGLEEMGLQTDKPAEERQLRVLSEQTKGIASEIHQLSRQLHPSQLETLGLSTALRSFCSGLAKQKGMQIEFLPGEAPGALPPDVALCLYRVAQEALQNAGKHSRARQVQVALTGNADSILLRIADDGVGFDPDSPSTNGGLGLVSMGERVRLVNGDLSVQSKPGKGTRIEVRIPVGLSTA